jgi:hypothetical protein
MIKKIIKFSKIIWLFVIFWFLNSGFSIKPIWQPIQAGFFAGVVIIMFKYTRIKLIHWVCLVGLCYVLSAILEIFNVQIFPDITANTGFGILVILVIHHFLKRSN